MSTSEVPKKLTLKSSDGVIFEVEEAVAIRSQTLKYMVGDNDCPHKTVPLSNVTGSILANVINFCQKHYEFEEAANKDNQSPLETFDVEFYNVEYEVLCHLINAATYLNIEDMLQLSIQAMADLIMGKSVQELRMMFNIEKTDFTPEEEEQFHKDYPWAFP